MTRLILATPLLALVGCHPLLCTEMGCALDYEAAVFELDPTRDWQSEQGATYVFTVSYDDQQLSCQAVVGGDESCDSELLTLGGFTTGTGDDTWVSYDALVLDAFPAQATLVIERDGEVVFEESFAIEPEVDHPNGAGCPPECLGWGSGRLTW